MPFAPMAAIGLLASLLLGAHALHAEPGGRTLAFALLTGGLLGLVLQRSRFCFYCHARDWFEDGNPRGLLAIVLALAVGSIGMTVILGGWVPLPEPGKLPPDMHIGPVSWVLALAGLVFGLGMVVSGSCISAHWYRLAEGSPVAPFALLGTALGFVLGFHTWNPLYSLSVAEAPVVWLPAHLGYGGALALQLAVLAAAAAWLWRGFARESGVPAVVAAVPDLRTAWQRLWTGRWPYWVGGLAVGAIAALTIVRMRPLGVTATLGSAARQGAQSLGWIPERLNGLDGFAGCATTPTSSWLTPNALVLAGLIAGAFIAGLASRQFAPRWPTW
ncbi:MAG: YeeE/YedE family protein, partial [Acidovorax sp.]|nr:YeeE/YedE family protein [Acidovorax sp.]